MEKFGFIILHYGDRSVTDRCVQSVFNLNKGSERDIHILLVDNDTDKDEYERLLLNERYREVPEVTVLKIEEKSGFSHANNLGFRKLKEIYDVDYVIVANNDITFEDKDFLEKCSNSYNRYCWDIMSPDVFSPEKAEHQSPIATTGRTLKELNHTIKLNEASLMTFPVSHGVVAKKLSTYGRGEFIRKKMMDIVPCGACIILSKGFTYKKETLFEPETDFYYEEYILHERCRRECYSIMYDPDIQVLHADGASTKERAADEKKRLKFLLKNTAKSAKIYRKYMYGV